MSGGPELLLVVGVGRSGTSLLTRLLGEVGFHIPQPEVEPDKTNPRGFGEPQWVVDFHMELMDARGMTVFDGRPKSWETTQAVAEDPAIRRRLRDWLAKELERAPYVVIKDPRVSWFQSLWRGAAGELGVTPSFVTTLRHPAEIVASAKHWYGPWQTDASRAAGWLNVMLRTEQATRGDRRAFVRYEDLMADWSGRLRAIGNTLGLPLLAELDPARYPQVAELVDPTLHRSRGDWSGLEVPVRVSGMADEVWDRILQLASTGETDAIQAALDEAHTAYTEVYSEAEAISQSTAIAIEMRFTKRVPPEPGKEHRPPGLRVRIARRIPLRHRRRLRRMAGALRRSG